MINTGIENYRIYNDTSDYDVTNNLTGILEFVGKETDNKGNTVYTKKEYKQTVYSMPKGQSIAIREPINIPKEINDANMRNQKIIEISTPEVVTSQDELLIAKLRREIDWASASTNKTNYFNDNDINNYSKSFTITNKNYYNCLDHSGTMAREIDCNKYKLSWIIIDGNSGEDKNIILKYNVTWSYEEYEYK